MKRKLAIILCVALCATTLFGCSSAETGYLKMSQDLGKIKACEMSGTVGIYYDTEAIKDFIFENLNSMEYTKEELQGMAAEFTGKKKIDISYKGSMELTEEDMKLYMDMSASVDGKQQVLGDMYVSVMDGIYVERDLILNLYMMSKDIFAGYDDSYFYSEDYQKSLRAALGTSEYIEIVNGATLQGQMGISEFSPSMTGMDAESNEAILNAAVKFLADMFSDYSTNAVSTVPGGYTISVTGDKLPDMISTLLGYLSQNIDVVADSLKTYMTSVFDIMKKSNPELFVGAEDLLEVFDFTVSQRADMAGAIAGVKGQFDLLVKSGNFDAVNAFSYKETVKKTGDTYTGESTLSLDDAGKNLAYIKSKSSVVPKTVEVTFPTTGTPFEQVVEAVKKLESKSNPVNSAEIRWAKSGEVEEFAACDINYQRAGSSPFVTKDKYVWGEYKNIDKAMYLPLRQLCDIFGEEVGWDNKTKQAYITKNGEKISVQGMLDTKTTYIKVKEFEKLGYTVIYDGKDADYHKVTITRE